MANLETIAHLADLDGVVLVDKPAGISSHDVVKTIKTHFNLVKVGHGGTLDPAATGVLTILVGNGTRLSAELMGGDKHYEAIMRLGRTTDTQDKEGNILSEKPFEGVTREQVETAMKEFRGDIYQMPPMFSAVKIHGRPLYEIARNGGEAERRERLVHVYRIGITDFAPPLVSFGVTCAKGVYVRTIAHDIGQMLGCGASLEALRRTKCCGFDIAESTPLKDLLLMHPMDFAAHVIPMAKMAIRS